MNFIEFLQIFKKNFFYFVAFTVLGFLASFFFLTNIKKEQGSRNYSEIIINSNVVSPHFLDEVNLILSRLDAINQINVKLIEPSLKGTTINFDISTLLSDISPATILEGFLDELINTKKMTSNLNNINMQSYIDQLTVSHAVADNKLNAVQLSYQGEDAENFIRELLNIVEQNVRENIRNNLIQKIEKVDFLKDYYKHINSNLLEIELTELKQKEEILKNLDQSGDAFDNIRYSKLVNQIDMQVLNKQRKLLDRGILIDILKTQLDLYFDTNPAIIKKYGLELNSFVLRQVNYSFFYIISFIITFFIFIIFLYLKEVSRKYLKLKND